MPGFVREVLEDPRQRGILIAGSLSLFAVGLVPRVLSPGLPNAQAMLKAAPEVENLFLLLSFLGTAAVLLGGLVSDLFRHRSLLVGGLAVMMLSGLASILIDDGPLFYATNFLAIGAAGVVLAYGIGSVAITYEGVPRATALGFVYAAYGAGAALAPAVLTIFPELLPSTQPGVSSAFTFDTRLAYGLSALSAAVAMAAAFRWVPRLPGSLPASRGLITSVALWSISLLAVVSGIFALGSSSGPILPTALIVGGGAVVVALSFRFRRTVQMVEGLHLDTRGLGAALAVGVTVGFSQAIPLMLLPVVFEYPLGYGQLMALLGIAPFAIALFLAGPISGVLMQRFGPRGMMAVGTLALGVADLLLAWFLRSVPDRANYLYYIAPLIFIGAGFVLSTTVRTAIVFASTPRGLPSSAAAINEASVGLGSRIGIVVGTTALTTAALESARSMVAGRADAGALVEEFRQALLSLGTPRFEETLQGLAGAPAVKVAAYNTAYIDGVIVALVISGIVGVAGALVAWFLTGRRDPLRTVFDMQDERANAAAEVSDGYA